MTDAIIKTLVTALAQPPHTPDCYNPYHGEDVYSELRRHNLSEYLTRMQALQPHLLLLFEAPGYRGCRLTGVPVTSRRMLLSGTGVFAGDYHDVPEPGFEHYQSEQTSTILWQTLADLQITPLLWNTLPFHPHQIGNSHSNRTPNRGETRGEMKYISQIWDIYPTKQRVAVGKVAARIFDEMGLNYTLIRHPAQGGKADFVRGLTALVNRN